MNGKLFAAAAVLLAALVFAGCAKKKPEVAVTAVDTVETSGGQTGPVSPGTTQKAPSGPDSFEGYDGYQVKFEDGKLKDGDDFDWRFFVGKSAAGMDSEILVISSDGGSASAMKITFKEGGYVLTRSGTEESYSALVSFELAEGAFSVLTNDSGMTAERFFGGAPSDTVRPGDGFDGGVVVYADHK